jgi:hypothetical protein
MKSICITRLGTLLLMGALVGCGNDGLGQVTGVVTLDGQPLPDALLVFTPVRGGRPASARTDESGRYALVYSRDAEGAAIGEHTGDASDAL